MAQSQQVKKYLAYWFQLGKKIVNSSGNHSLMPKKILNGHGYSSEFENLWKLITQEHKYEQYYLEGTRQTIKQLLSSQWDIVNCARCDMPVPIIELGQQNNHGCVCDDLDNWPNNELPLPRQPVNTQHKLIKIRESLMSKEG